MDYPILRRSLVLLILFAFSGCTYVSDHLSLNADGSGTVEIHTTVASQFAMMASGQRAAFSGQSPRLLYPPMSKAEAKQLFPGDGFNVSYATENEGDDEQHHTVTVTFADADALLNTPYAAAHSLVIDRDEQAGKLTVRWRTGLQAIAAMDSMANDQEATQAYASVGLNATQLEQMRQNFKVECALTLPNAVAAEAATTTDGQAATWTIDRATADSGEAFAAELNQMMIASCPDTGVTFTPQSPARLDLVPFDQLEEPSEVSASESSVDAERVEAEARVKPLLVMIKRTFNLTGEGWGGENHGTVIGVVSLPRTLEPIRWGAFELETAVDDQGNSLVPTEDDRSIGNRYDLNSGWYGYGMFGDEEDEEQAEGSAEPDHVDRFITVALAAPHRDAQAVAQLTGSIKAYYGGSSTVVKLPNVIQATSDGFNFRHGDDSAGIDHFLLKQMHMKVTPGGATAQAGATIVMLTVSSQDAVIREVQIFDAEGVAWPTIPQMTQEMGEDQWMQVVVIGKPKMPLSLALLVDASGASIDLPVSFTDLPLHPLPDEVDHTKEGIH
jgi:hypothetical protein